MTVLSNPLKQKEADMPCYDPRSDSRTVYETDPALVRENQQLRNDLNERTAQLCKLCGLVQQAGVRALIGDAGLDKWWEEHQEFDRQRIAREKDQMTGFLPDKGKEQFGAG